jgi:hypothetical protein
MQDRLVRMNVAPRPRPSLCAAISPPCAINSDRAIVSPNPSPP